MNNSLKMVCAAVLLAGGFAAFSAVIAAVSSGVYVGRFAASASPVEAGCRAQDRLSLGRYRSERCTRPDAEWINCASGGDCAAINGETGELDEE